MFLIKIQNLLKPVVRAVRRTKSTDPTIHFAESILSPLKGESVLEALLRHGHVIPHGCRAGACQSCVMVSEDEVPAQAQVGLTSAQKENGYFLSCSCYPTRQLKVALPVVNNVNVTAHVMDKTLLNENVIRLRLNTDLPYKAGQFITVSNAASVSRSYSIASVAALDEYIELHIKSIEGGLFSGWIRHELNVGDTLTLTGPMGECFYTPDATNKPLLLAGIGTGLAPLYGVLRDALLQGHQGKIYLCVAAQDSSQFYLMSELNALATLHPQLDVTFMCLANTMTLSDVQEGNVYDYIQETFPNLKGYKVFVCGADSFVKKLTKQCFLSGTAMADISADTFLPSAPVTDNIARLPLA